MSLSQVLKTLKCWELLCTMVTITGFVFVHFIGPHVTTHLVLQQLFILLFSKNLSPPLYSTFVLIGDFNVNVLDTSSSLYHCLHDTLSSFNLLYYRLYKNQLVWTHVELLVSSTWPYNVQSQFTAALLCCSTTIQLRSQCQSSRKVVITHKFHPQTIWKYSLADFPWAITMKLDILTGYTPIWQKYQWSLAILGKHFYVNHQTMHS